MPEKDPARVRTNYAVFPKETPITVGLLGNITNRTKKENNSHGNKKGTKRQQFENIIGGAS